MPFLKKKLRAQLPKGKLADFVVLENDPREVPPETIKDIVLEATYLGGEKVYAAAAKAVAIVPQPLLNYGDGN
jgi:Amidohydrolase family